MSIRVYTIDEAPQGELEWFRLHLGRPTASEFGRFLTTSFEFRKGEMPESYLNKKLAEKIQGHALPGFTSKAIENGIDWESQARAAFDILTGLPVHQVGFIESGRAGCSPDGLIGEEEGLEIKCPNADTHVGYLRDGVVPNEYLLQVHGSLYVTGRKRWHFFSYRQRFDPLHVIVERDEEVMRKIGDGVAKFCARFDAALKQLTHSNDRN